MDDRAGPMKNTVFGDPNVSPDIRRRQLYNGQLFVNAAGPSVLALTNFARPMTEDAFGGVDPKNGAKEPPRLSSYRPTPPSSRLTYGNRFRGRAG